MSPHDGKRAPFGWQVARLVTSGSAGQAFLDRRWIGWLISAAPSRYRRAVALRILSLSPHYFIYQWGGYPDDWKRDRVLEAEFERNRSSRVEIAKSLLAPALLPDSRVLDFGCGPGFLARLIGERVREVVAVDVSSGVLACARELNPGPVYRLATATGLPVADASIDAIYSIAVLQHIPFSEWAPFFDGFLRALRPGGRCICHVAIADGEPRVFAKAAGLRGLYTLHFSETTADAVISLLERAGFVDVRLFPVRDVATLDDDVGRSHLVTFSRPTDAAANRAAPEHEPATPPTQ